MGGRSSSTQYQETTSITDSYNRALTQQLSDVGNIKINLPEEGTADNQTLWLVGGAVAVAAIIFLRK